MRAHRAVILAATTLLALSALSCGGGKKNPVNPGGGADVTINIVGNSGSNSYNPDPDTVGVGQTVSWHNSDATGHTATSTSTNAFGTGVLAPGQTSVKVAMNTPGTINYHCTIHAGMVGTLVVK